MNEPTQLEKNFEVLRQLSQDQRAKTLLAFLLDDMRLRFGLALSPICLSKDGSLNLPDTIRKGTAYEIHNLYAPLLGEKQRAGEWLNLH